MIYSKPKNVHADSVLFSVISSLVYIKMHKIRRIVSVDENHRKQCGIVDLFHISLSSIHLHSSGLIELKRHMFFVCYKELGLNVHFQREKNVFIGLTEENLSKHKLLCLSFVDFSKKIVLRLGT